MYTKRNSRFTHANQFSSATVKLRAKVAFNVNEKEKKKKQRTNERKEIVPMNTATPKAEQLANCSKRCSGR